MILCDRQIRELALAGMIEPFTDGQVRERDGQRLISYGLSSAGYDLQLGDEFMWPADFAEGGRHTVDPKGINESLWDKLSIINDYTVIEPGEHVLGHSVEYLRIPDTIIATAVGKSTYARCGLIINVTPLEPGWEGQLTIEMHNASLCPIRVYPGEGICQLMFSRIERPDVTYGDRKGKYQGQRGVTLPRV